MNLKSRIQKLEQTIPKKPHVTLTTAEMIAVVETLNARIPEVNCPNCRECARSDRNECVKELEMIKARAAKATELVMYIQNEHRS